MHKHVHIFALLWSVGAWYQCSLCWATVVFFVATLHRHSAVHNAIHTACVTCMCAMPQCCQLGHNHLLNMHLLIYFACCCARLWEDGKLIGTVTTPVTKLARPDCVMVAAAGSVCGTAGFTAASDTSHSVTIKQPLVTQGNVAWTSTSVSCLANACPSSCDTMLDYWYRYVIAHDLNSATNMSLLLNHMYARIILCFHELRPIEGRTLAVAFPS